MLISCICITRNRRKWLPKMIACFQAQTWEEKELIILADSLSDVSGLQPDDERISVYIPRCKESWSIGEKRNVAIEMATGELIANLDDDDYSAPERLEDQAQRLIDSGKSVTSYRNLQFTDGQRWWRNTNWPLGFGSTHTFRREWWEKHPYPHEQIGEDLLFLAEAMRKKQYVAGDAKEFMYASIHSDNTSPRVIGDGWEEIAEQRSAA